MSDATRLPRHLLTLDLSMPAHLPHTTAFFSQQAWGMEVPRNPLPPMNQAITRTAKGDGVTVTLTYIPDPEDKSKVVQLTALHIQLQTPERAAEMVALLQRALNTSDPDVTPDWALQVIDYLTGVPAPTTREQRMARIHQPAGVSTGYMQLDDNEVPYVECPDHQACTTNQKCLERCSQKSEAEGKIVVMPDGRKFPHGKEITP